LQQTAIADIGFTSRKTGCFARTIDPTFGELFCHMATPIAARLPADSATPPSLVTRLHIFLIERRVAVSVALFAIVIAVYATLFEERPHDVLALTDPLVVVGLALVLAGLVVRSWAAGTLRKYKQLITSGPYALVRNPLYVGSFLMMAGFCTLIGNVVVGCLVIVPMIVLYWLAVRDEEQILERFFPDQWPAYAARVPRFVPRLTLPTSEGWSLAQWRRNHERNAWLGAALALAGLRAWWMLLA
jgi:protein-S-isoprenylcysteine O-methyltransferase Ste14